jgi:hypothetical protein
VDSRDGTKLIRKLVWPQLEARGFETFTTRSAWRYWDEGIEVVNFQALGLYTAPVIGCTPFSFALNLGVRLQYVPSDADTKERNGRPAPEEYECHLREHPAPSIPQRRYEIGPQTFGTSTKRGATRSRTWRTHATCCSEMACVGSIATAIRETSSTICAGAHSKAAPAPTRCPSVTT